MWWHVRNGSSGGMCAMVAACTVATHDTHHQIHTQYTTLALARCGRHDVYCICVMSNFGARVRKAKSSIEKCGVCREIGKHRGLETTQIARLHGRTHATTASVPLPPTPPPPPPPPLCHHHRPCATTTTARCHHHRPVWHGWRWWHVCCAVVACVRCVVDTCAMVAQGPVHMPPPHRTHATTASVPLPPPPPPPPPPLATIRGAMEACTWHIVLVV